MTQPPFARPRGLCLCHSCHYVAPISKSHCPRCHARLHVRKPDSFARSWALMIAALICYIPANVLPVMHTVYLGRSLDSTIISGVIEFWKSGSWDVALVIFVASIGVPFGKFFILTLLLVPCQRQSRWAKRERSRLYRFIEFIGYWSMLDVLVVALVTALVQFRVLSNIEPRPGILFFGLVVVLTMLATMAFEPRTIWDPISQDTSNDHV